MKMPAWMRGLLVALDRVRDSSPDRLDYRYDHVLGFISGCMYCGVIDDRVFRLLNDLAANAYRCRYSECEKWFLHQAANRLHLMREGYL